MASHILSIYALYYLLHYIHLLKPHPAISLLQLFLTTDSKQINPSMAIFSWFRTILNGTATVFFRCVLRCFRFVFFMGPPQKQINPSMPSSSSSSHSTPPSSSSSTSSSSQFWSHHVFLSFRGTDTRNGFVDHLYSALDQRGIHTYKDDETLPRGETIGPSLFKAIEESQIAVIVFSENYAESSWCLQELAHIMKCKDENGLIVMPIFYHIDPSELRKQKGKYGKALAKHRSQNKNVESWSKALVDAGNLSGDVADGSTREKIFINKIVNTINRLCVPISSDDEGLVGIKARLHDLKSKREMQSEGVVMVGIWGSGGAGKTTLASSLYDEISSEFDVCCFVENIREKSSNSDGLQKLQDKLLSVVLNQTQINRVEDGKRLIKDRFCHKRVLIVLDDVSHVDQLKALGGSHDWFGEGSRIIITTRDMHLLTAHKVNVIYNISLLGPDEAMKLFRKHAPQRDRPIEEYEKLSKEVVSYSGGLPLALKVLGSFLCDKDKSEWISALARLKEIPHSDIVEKLKISYDGLTPLEKELFLDIACFFRGDKKDDAMEILDACGFHPIIGVKVLTEKTLITVSKAGTFEMHDLIQEMGRYIIRGENPKNPELHSRVWQLEDVAKMDAMKENYRIKALLVRWFILDQDILPSSLPQVIDNMKKLRWFSWHKYPESSFSREFQPKELCFLRLEDSLLEQLWEGYKLLPNLKVLNLTYSKKLIRTPDFKGLPCLERMTFMGCWSLKEIHPSIGYLERLISLDMGRCTSLELFPPIVRMKKLETLILSNCYELRKPPEIHASMDNLKELCLSWSGIEVVPSSIGEYCTNLLSLDLSHCLNLQSIVGNFLRLKALKRLYLRACDLLENMPEEGWLQQQLSSPFFDDVRRGAVNELLGFPGFLTRLSLVDCGLVDGDISVLCKELSNLQVLDLSYNEFSRLHSSLSQLSRLKYLNLSGCSNLVELPDLPSSIAILIAKECKSLVIKGDFPTNQLKWLWKVSLSESNYIGKRVLQLMLQTNAIEDYFVSIRLDMASVPISDCKLGIFTLLLPQNWYDQFSGFLVYVNDPRLIDRDEVEIIMKDVTGSAKENDVLEEYNGVEGFDSFRMCYIPFNLVRHSSRWNRENTTISFSINNVWLNVKLVDKRSQSDDSIERTKGKTYRSEFWDEESWDQKTFEVIDDSRSSIKIRWCHDVSLQMSPRKRRL